MNFEELKKELKKIERQEAMCHARYVRTRETYKRQNAPLHLRKYERITVRLRVTEETRKHLVDKELSKRKNQVGYEYSVTGCFTDWYIHEDGNGELKPCLFGDVSYSRFDEIVSIEPADQIEGHCSKCRRYKDGLCYMAGGKDISKKCATHKVGKDDFTCPKYEELTELWSADGKKHYPNVTILKHSKPLKYLIYSLNWQYYEEWKENEVEKFYRFDNPNEESDEDNHT